MFINLVYLLSEIFDHQGINFTRPPEITGIDAVKLLFDDFGTLRINTQAFRRDLKSRGIEMSIFNPIHREDKAS